MNTRRDLIFSGKDKVIQSENFENLYCLSNEH